MSELSLSETGQVDDIAKQWAEEYVDKGVTTSQLRQIYSEVKRAENEFRFEDDPEKAKRTLLLLKPRIAYAAARKSEMNIVNDRLSKRIDKATNGDTKCMEIFFQLMEGIVAYHAYYSETGGH